MSKKEYWTDSLTPQRLWAIFWVQLDEGYQINVIYPFVVFMMRDFGIAENSVALYAGLLTATFALTQFLSSYGWGYFSDVYGRRKALLLGALVSAISIVCFGFSVNYAQAIIARSLSGIFNGNLGVARAYVADITNSKNRPFAFSIFAIAFSAGIVLGSVAGGALIETWELDEEGTHRPSEGVLKWWIFGTFPYLLPCAVGAVISMISFVCAFMYVQDLEAPHTAAEATQTLLYDGSSVDGVRHDHELADAACQSRSLPMVSLSSLHESSSYAQLKKTSTVAAANESKDDLHLLPSALEGAPAATLGFEGECVQMSLISTNAMATHSLYEGIEAFKKVRPETGKLLSRPHQPHQQQQTPIACEVEINSLWQLFSKTSIGHGLVINSTIMLMLVAWNSMVPYLMAQTLLMNSTEIGLYMSWTGFMLFVFTWYIQPPLMRRFAFRHLYIFFGCAMLVVILLFPTITLIPGVLDWNKYVLLMLVAFVGGFKQAFATNMFVASMCFINNAVPAKAVGRANGLSNAVGSGLRGFGPLFGGMLWSWSMTLESQYAVYIAYIYMFIPSAYSVLHCWCFISQDIQLTWEERHAPRQQAK